MNKLSAVIITKNEEKNIKDCLCSVRWADEIIVVDDLSTDQTREIAESFGARVLKRKMDVEGIHRNFAYAQAKNAWVLSLDADERVTEELKKEIENIIAQETNFAGFTIPRRNHLGSYWIKYGGLYPSAQLRLFKKEKFRYEEAEVHPRVFLEGECGHLKSDIIHFNFRDFSHYFAKLNSQTTLEAKKMFKSGKKYTRGKYLWRAIDRFFRSYFCKQGFRDGFIGFMVAYFAAVYQIISYAKYWELKKVK
ncbi:MAG: glycosyltransferase family 2 protein [Candidatus Omnitrophota bacterium]